MTKDVGGWKRWSRGDGGKRQGAIRGHGGGRGEEAAGVGVLRRTKEVAGGGVLDDAAALHDSDVVRMWTGGLVTGLGDDREVVGDEEHGQVVGAAEVREEGEDLGLDGDVEGGGGFVGDEEAGTVDEGHGDEEALTLAAGELVGVVAVAGFRRGKADLVHGRQHPGQDGGARGAGMVGQEGFGDLATDAHDGVEGGHGLLEDHGDGGAAEGAHAGFGKGEEGLGVEEYLPGDAGGRR